MSAQSRCERRRVHDCGWGCGSDIRPGVRYVRSSIPPWTEPNESPHWWSMALHGHSRDDCPTYGGPHEVDPRVEASER